MPASLIITISTLVTLLTTAGGIAAITGEPSVNGTLGENVNIAWKVQNFIHTKWLIYANNTEDRSQLFTIDYQNYKTNDTFGKAPTGSHDNLQNRSSASYYYTGNSGGQETGQVVLIIRDLRFEDSCTFILRDGKEFIVNSSTILSVYYGPEKCGSGLESEYIVNMGDQLNVTMGFCGKPQPIVTCKFDGQNYTSVNVTEVNQCNYTYTFVIPTNLKPGEKKQLSCTATGHGEPVKRQNVVKSPEQKMLSHGACAGYIVGFEIGYFILICAVIYVYLVVWRATAKKTEKRVCSIIAVVVGFVLMIGMIVSYADLRKSVDNHNCGKDSWHDCDVAFIVLGVIDALVIVVVAGVLKCMKEVKMEKSGTEK